MAPYFLVACAAIANAVVVWAVTQQCDRTTAGMR